MSTKLITGKIPPFNINEGMKILEDYNGIMEILDNKEEKRSNYGRTEHWSARWIKCKDGKDECIILPVSTTAKKRYKEYFIQKWMNDYGLNETWANKLYDNEFPQKWKNIDKIITAFKDEKMWEAVCNYPKHHSPNAYKKWLEKYQDVVTPHLDNFKPLRVKWAFINFLKSFL